MYVLVDSAVQIFTGLKVTNNQDNKMGVLIFEIESLEIEKGDRKINFYLFYQLSDFSVRKVIVSFPNF